MKTKSLMLIVVLMGIFFTGCLKDEVFQGPPSVSDLTITPQAPSENETVMVSVKVTDLNGVQSVSLFYAPGAEAMTKVDMTANGETYTANIPGQASDVTVNYYVAATNVNGQTTYFPEGAPQTTASYTVGAPLILMNEIYSRGTAADPDWVEIYNASDIAVDISGYLIYDAGGQSGSKPKKAFPEGSVVAAKGFLVIVVDTDDEAGFGISSGGDELWLENASGNLIDNVNCLAMEPTQSYGRNPDGSNNWELLNTITKGAPNSTSDPVAIVKMNEIYSKGNAENPDWIEIYNTSDFEADISGFKIYDSGGQEGTKPKKEIPAGTIIPAHGWTVIVVDTEDESGFGLSSGGEDVWLENAAGEIIDNISFPALEENQSYGRYPDGDSNLQTLYVVTPGAANDNTMPPAGVVLMNELYSRGTTENPDWIEIYNAGESTINLTGYKIYDSGGQSGSKPKKEFPAETMIAPGAYYVIVVDTEDESGFGLSSGGEEVWFENPAGDIVDNVVFPAMEETQSYGRYPDGTDSWQLLHTITPGAANDNTMPPPTVSVLMNEAYSRGTTENPDWIEIYNTTDAEIDLSGFKIYDNGGQSGSKPKKEFEAGTVIPANGFYVIVVDTEDESGFGLSSGGDEVWLENADGQIIDNISFGAMEETQSYGRKPDGSDNFVIFTEITRGSSNNNAGTLP